VAGVIAAWPSMRFSSSSTICFPAGSFTFDPRTDRLVQLSCSPSGRRRTIVLGVVIVAIAAVVAMVTGRGPARDWRAGHARRNPARAGPMNGVPVARILGFEVRLHLSWLFIVAIVTVTVAGGFRPSARHRPTAHLGDRARGSLGSWSR